MARFSEPKQKRAITKQYGMYVVKTPDMCTYHREFIDAVESYGVVYGRAPIAGPIEAAKQLPLTQELTQRIKDRQQREDTFIKMGDDYTKQALHFEEVMRKSQGIMKKIAEDKAQRLRDRVRYCEAMTKVLGGSESNNDENGEAA